MIGKVFSLLVGVLLGAGGMILLTSGPPPVVQADCPGPQGTPCGNGDVDGNGRLQISDAVYILLYLFVDGPKPAVLACVGNRLPATGQRLCYDYSETDCDNPDYPGQDGFYQAGCPTEGRFIDNGDGTVTDNCTGLMWQQATADINGDQEITPNSDEIYWPEALQYCENLDFAGHTDWRLPNVRELQSIVDYGRFNPSIDPMLSVMPKWYWSSTCLTSAPRSAWYVGFNIARVGFDDKHDEQCYVRAVRGGL